MQDGKDFNSPSLVNPNPLGSVMILTADNTEDLEFFYPYYRLVEAGYRVDVFTPAGGKLTAKHGETLYYTNAVSQAKAEDYDMLYIPGGKAPGTLRDDDEVIELVQRFAATGRPIAAICHGPQVLVDAELIEGKRIAAWPEVADEVREAGATYVDEPAVTDGQFITGRWPGDLPSFTKAMLKALEAGVGITRQRRAS